MLDLDFAELSLADLVADEDVRKTLSDAQEALKAGDRKSAFLNVRLAFDKLHRMLVSDIALIKRPRGIKVPKRALPDETKQGLLNLQGVVFDLVHTLNILMLGIDPVRYRFLIANTPAVSWTFSGQYQALFTHNYDDVPDEVFQTCFEFVVEVALNASR